MSFYSGWLSLNDDALLPNINADLNFRADFGLKKGRGAFMSTGLGVMWVFPSLGMRAGYRF